MLYITRCDEKIWEISDDEDEENLLYVTHEDMEQLRDMLTAALQDNDITKSQYLKTKGEVQ